MMLHRRSLFSPSYILPASLFVFFILLSRHLTPFLTPLLDFLLFFPFTPSQTRPHLPPSPNSSEDERFLERGRQNDVSFFLISTSPSHSSRLVSLLKASFFPSSFSWSLYFGFPHPLLFLPSSPSVSSLWFFPSHSFAHQVKTLCPFTSFAPASSEAAPSFLLSLDFKWNLRVTINGWRAGWGE